MPRGLPAALTSAWPRRQELEPASLADAGRPPRNDMAVALRPFLRQRGHHHVAVGSALTLRPGMFCKPFSSFSPLLLPSCSRTPSRRDSSAALFSSLSLQLQG